MEKRKQIRGKETKGGRSKINKIVWKQMFPTLFCG